MTTGTFKFKEPEWKSFRTAKENAHHEVHELSTAAAKRALQVVSSLVLESAIGENLAENHGILAFLDSMVNNPESFSVVTNVKDFGRFQPFLKQGESNVCSIKFETKSGEALLVRVGKSLELLYTPSKESQRYDVVQQVKREIIIETHSV